MENIDTGLTVPKMVSDSLAENAPDFICPICIEVLDFNEKRLHWASVIHVSDQT